MVFFLNYPGPTETYTYGPTLSLHDALPSWARPPRPAPEGAGGPPVQRRVLGRRQGDRAGPRRQRGRAAPGDARPLRQARAPAPHPGTQAAAAPPRRPRSEEHTSELQSLMRISYAVFCLKKKNEP